jgi:subtilisin
MSATARIWPLIDEARRSLQHGTGRGIKVAVLDSGIETGHPFLEGMSLADDLAIELEGNRLRAAAGEGRDTFGHGTAIAGIIHRMAPEAQIGSFRVLGQDLRSRSMIIRAAALLAIDRGYHIINCSFGCSREDHVLLYKDWIDAAYLQDRHIVAACNNQDFSRREWPGHFPTVITVKSQCCSSPEEFHYYRGNLSEFSASGENVVVAWLGGRIKKVTGSSFAVPHVAGLLARLMSGLPDLSSLQAKALLASLASRGITNVTSSQPSTS